MLKMLDLFSGIGGFSLAASWTGAIETIAFCEIEPFCQKVLKKHWPDVPIFPDITKLRGDEVGTVDIVCGGFPCQPWSIAGEQLGECDTRNLWPATFEIISKAKPRWFVGENVPGLSDEYLDEIYTNLESEGFTVWPIEIPAVIVGSPHFRNRLWIVAHANGEGLEGIHNEGRGINLQPVKKTVSRYIGNPTPRIYRRSDGIPNKMDRLKSLGNSIVPAVAFQLLNGIAEIERG